MKIFIVLAAILLAGGCGGSETASKNPGTPPSNAEKAPVQTQSSPSTSSESVPSANTQESPIALARNKKIEAMRKAGSQPGQRPDIEQILARSTRPAPESSEFSVALTDILYERRVFLNNPILAKVEKISEGEKKQIKVYLKDGRVVDVAGDAIASLSTASSLSIMRAAKLPVPERDGRGDTKPNAPAKN